MTRHSVLVALALLAAVASVACGRTVVGPSETPASILAVSYRGPSGTLTDGPLPFGDVRVGDLSVARFEIANNGNMPLTVTGIGGLDPEVFLLSWTGGVIHAGYFQPVSVRFQPRAATDYSGVIIVLADHVAGTDRLVFTARGIDGGAAPSPSPGPPAPGPDPDPRPDPDPDPGPAPTSCFPDLPRPRLRFDGTESYTDFEGTPYLRYWIAVVNHASFPDELFLPAPDLPACGLNENASRTWVDIVDGRSGSHIYGFCSKTSAAGLDRLWFGVPVGRTPPGSITVRLRDRRCSLEYTSDPLAIP